MPGFWKNKTSEMSEKYHHKIRVGSRGHRTMPPFLVPGGTFFIKQKIYVSDSGAGELILKQREIQ